MTFCDAMDCSTPCLPVHHQLLELAQTHVHWVSDAIQPCHPTISSSVVSSSCPQSFPASGSFQMSQLFASGGQSIGVSASTSVLPVNTQDWSPLEWTGWIFLQSKGLSRVHGIPHKRMLDMLEVECSYLVWHFVVWFRRQGDGGPSNFTRQTVFV